MIPKIVHYTWFSGEEMPQRIKDCMASWQRWLPDYEFRLWDREALEGIDSIFLKEALSVKKWAYAADYVRLYALYNEGGIYLDTDVIVFKPFDELLGNRSFIGKEDALQITPLECKWVQYLSSHCMGAEPQAEFVKDCLKYYEGRHFIQSYDESLPQSLRYNYVILPFVQAVVAHQDYGYDWRPKVQTIQYGKSGLVIYPTDYFCGHSYLSCSFCQHLALGSWREDYVQDREKIPFLVKWKRRIVRKIKRILLVRFSYIIQKIH